MSKDHRMAKRLERAVRGMHTRKSDFVCRIELSNLDVPLVRDIRPSTLIDAEQLWDVEVLDERRRVAQQVTSETVLVVTRCEDVALRTEFGNLVKASLGRIN